MALGFLSQCSVYWAGFRSSIAELYSSGWKLQSDNDPMYYETRVALTNPEMRLIGFLPDHRMLEPARGEIIIKQILQGDYARIQMMDMPRFRPIMPSMDMNDTSMMMREFRLCELFEFEDAQELIIDPKDVQFHLDKIIELQRPKQKELRQEATKQAKKTQAKIISLVDFG